jgi:hypothetical protein
MDSDNRFLKNEFFSEPFHPSFDRGNMPDAEYRQALAAEYTAHQLGLIRQCLEEISRKMGEPKGS